MHLGSLSPMFLVYTIKSYSSLNRNITGLFLTPFLLLLELVLLLAVFFVIVRHISVRCLMVMTIVRRWRLAGAIQPRELGGTDLLRAGGACHAPWVLSPALLCRAAAGGQEALSHGCSALITPLAAGTSPLHHTCSRQKLDNNSTQASIRQSPGCASGIQNIKRFLGVFCW